ncbi:hypothetical protein [Streptomyces sp. CC224B]|uniref:hypothetical protein n=1 Tax=Streptomyces sp. CC224B TaxID=3044571 RepID=UPI0024A9EF50|nr:hypothetical protein [Streptomyces sp. CC224B]
MRIRTLGTTALLTCVLVLTGATAAHAANEDPGDVTVLNLLNILSAVDNNIGA